MIYGKVYITYWARQQRLLSRSDLQLGVFKTGFKQIKSKKHRVKLELFSIVWKPGLTAATRMPTQRRVLTRRHAEPKQLLFLMSAPILSFSWVSGAGVKSQRKEFDALRAAGQRVWDDGSVTAVSFTGLDLGVTQAEVDCTDDCNVKEGMVVEWSLYGQEINCCSEASLVGLNKQETCHSCCLGGTLPTMVAVVA